MVENKEKIDEKELSSKREYISIGIGEERQLSGFSKKSLEALITLFITFLFYSAIFGGWSSLIQRSLFMAFIMPTAFMLYGFSKGRIFSGRVPFYDLILCAMGIVTTLYITFNNGRLVECSFATSIFDIPFGAIILILVLEAARRTTGIIFPIMTLALIAYALAGPHLPGTWAHVGFSLRDILEYLYLSNTGLWGPLLGIAVTLLPMFILFGSILVATGGTDSLMEIAVVCVGRFLGGAGKISVITSALFGTVSGSAVANVVVDGVFTIPTMKRLKYPGYLAAAIEAANSTGGQVLPPVMGAAAFVMAELIGIPYISIAKAAAIPGILYFYGCYMTIHYEAKRLNLAAIPRNEIPRSRDVFTIRKMAPLIGPTGVLIYFLLTGWTPDRAAFYAVISSIIIYFIPYKGSIGFIDKVKNLRDSLLNTGKGLLSTGILCACIQIIVGLLSITGLAVKFSAFLMSASSSNLLWILLLTAVLSAFLGMAAPTTAAYVLTASICAPGLIQAGIDPFVAHMFCLYFATFSAITPPVAGASVVASAIAQEKFWKVGWAAIKMAIVAFIVPFAFVYEPALLLIGTPFQTAFNCVGAFFGAMALAAATSGYFQKKLKIIERIIIFLAGCLLFHPFLYINGISFILLAGIFVKQKYFFLAKEKNKAVSFNL
ncbi:MAG: TRAP transporter fused permease subunit [Deltaproteobacteria bacterium]|nr:TRAP transporter fused permease subunit [Deltaproteobacteria bacterium]